MASADGLKEVGFFDCAGGGQIRVDGTTAYIGHMANPFGTSIVDVSDPKNPTLLSHTGMPEGTHSHKVHARDNIMVRNHELIGPGKPENFSVAWVSMTFRTNPTRGLFQPGIPSAGAFTVSISMGAICISRQPSKGIVDQSWWF